jgi:hypothetical protein
VSLPWLFDGSALEEDGDGSRESGWHTLAPEVIFKLTHDRSVLSGRQSPHLFESDVSVIRTTYVSSIRIIDRCVILSEAESKDLRFA